MARWHLRATPSLPKACKAIGHSALVVTVSGLADGWSYDPNGPIPDMIVCRNGANVSVFGLDDEAQKQLREVMTHGQHRTQQEQAAPLPPPPISRNSSVSMSSDSGTFISINPSNSTELRRETIESMDNKEGQNIGKNSGISPRAPSVKKAPTSFL